MIAGSLVAVMEVDVTEQRKQEQQQSSSSEIIDTVLDVTCTVLEVSGEAIGGVVDGTLEVVGDILGSI